MKEICCQNTCYKTISKESFPDQREMIPKENMLSVSKRKPQK